MDKETRAAIKKRKEMIYQRAKDSKPFLIIAERSLLDRSVKYEYIENPRFDSSAVQELSGIAKLDPSWRVRRYAKKND